jgi:hypothetical protein
VDTLHEHLTIPHDYWYPDPWEAILAAGIAHVEESVLRPKLMCIATVDATDFLVNGSPLEIAHSNLPTSKTRDPLLETLTFEWRATKRKELDELCFHGPYDPDVLLLLVNRLVAQGLLLADRCSLRITFSDT